MRVPFLRLAIACLLSSMLATPLLADTLITLVRNGAGELPVEYRDADNLRIGRDDAPNWYLTVDGKDFVIMASPDGSKRFAMNMDEFLARDDAPPGVEPDLESFTATRADRQETIQGVNGQVYLINGQGRSWELVLTEDDTVAAVTEAVYGAEIRMARMSGQAASAQPLASELALARSLGAAGILRGQLYTLAGMSQEEALSDERFRLASDTMVIKDWKEMQDAYH